MGKKRKDSKPKGKDKKGKKSLEKTPKKPQIDPELLKDLDLKDVFRFWNGDVYVGQFTLTLEGEILRQGRGKYFAADGCSFIGDWDADVLVEAEKFSYPDGSWYHGPLESGKYSGLGSYGHPQLGTLDCNFVQGRPEEVVTLSDIDGNKWQGLVAQGSLTLFPRNHFFDSEEALLRSRQSIDKDESKSLEKKSMASQMSKMRRSHISQGSLRRQSHASQEIKLAE